MNESYNWTGVSWYINVKDHHMSFPKCHSSWKTSDKFQFIGQGVSSKTQIFFCMFYIYEMVRDLLIPVGQAESGYGCQCVATSEVVRSVSVVLKEFMEKMKDSFKAM